MVDCKIKYTKSFSYRSTINRSNILYGKITFKINIVRTSLNCICEEQDKIMTNNNNLCEDNKLITRYNY